MLSFMTSSIKLCLGFFATLTLVACGDSGTKDGVNSPWDIEQESSSSEGMLPRDSVFKPDMPPHEGEHENHFDDREPPEKNPGEWPPENERPENGWPGNERPGNTPWESSSSLELPEGISSSSFKESSSSVQFLSPYIIGADISKFQEYESYNTVIYDVDGSEKTIFELLKDHGFNAIRLKTFVSPKAKNGYASEGCGADSESFGDKEHVIAYAKKVKRNGFKFLLDIHYSDNWADPNSQIIPERWRGVTSSDAMADSVYNYTLDLLSALKSAGAMPDMVQIGNEITNGMLRDLPTSSTNCWGDNVVWAPSNINGVMENQTGISNTVKYLKSGIKAARAVSNDIKTVLHIESFGKPTTVNWWMNAIIKNGGVPADIMAFSAYTAYGDGGPSNWESLLNSLANAYPNLEFLIAEYNGGDSKNNYNFDGSRAETNLMMRRVKNGLGAFFWEPASYGEWGAALFDWEGNTLHANKKAMDEYKLLF